MTESDFFILEKFYRDTKALIKEIKMCPGDSPEYAELKLKFDNLDHIDFLLKRIPQKIRSIDKRLDEARNFVLNQTKGMIRLPDELIIGILEKATT